MTRWRTIFVHKNLRRRFFRISLVLANVVLLGLVIGVVVLNPTRTGGAPQVTAAGGTPTVTQPLDSLASVNIAVTVAGMTNLPEFGGVVSQANSQRIQLAVASTNTEVVNKPQVVSSAFVSNKDIHTYVVQPGDTVSSIASKFNLSTNSILWSNNLLTNTISAGQKLLIPPVNGIVYTIKAGDTASSLASKYQSNEAKIIDFNDAEINGFQVGEQIIIPDGQIAVIRTAYYGYAYGFAFGTGAIYGYNGYDFGNCTWYVASQISVPANWGNASTWAAGARAAGWHVSPTPSVGAIAQNSWMAGGLGHVAIVDGVSADGSQVLIRDMNGVAGFDRVGVAWEPASYYPNYITR